MNQHIKAVLFNFINFLDLLKKYLFKNLKYLLNKLPKNLKIACP